MWHYVKYNIFIAHYIQLSFILLYKGSCVQFLFVLYLCCTLIYICCYSQFSLMRIQYTFMWLVHTFSTYIHNWPLQPFKYNYVLTSHTTHVNFISAWRDLQFQIDCEREIFDFFIAGLFTLGVFVRSLLWRNPRRSMFFHIPL